MSIKIEINEKQIKNNEEKLNVHFMPAKIASEDGEADVDNYFNKYTHKDADGFWKNSFRGYPLQGEVTKIPENFLGLVLQEHCSATPMATQDDKEANETSAASRRLKVRAAFDEFYYWNYDKVPSKGDPYKQALQILDVANELSKPVAEDDVVAELEQYAKKERGTAAATNT